MNSYDKKLAKAKLLVKENEPEVKLSVTDNSSLLKLLDIMSDFQKDLGDNVQNQSDQAEVFEVKLEGLRKGLSSLTTKLTTGIEVSNLPEQVKELAIKNLSEIKFPDEMSIKNLKDYPDDLATNQAIKDLGSKIEKFMDALSKAQVKTQKSVSQSQRPDDYIPYRRVVKEGNRFKFDDALMGGGGGGGSTPTVRLASGGYGVPVVNPDGTNISGGSSGGGATTIVDGGDVAQGAIADVAVTAGSTGTISGKLRQISADIASVIKTEDTGHSSGDKGIFMLAVRNDSGAVLAGNDLDYIPFTVDSTGALRTDLNGTVSANNSTTATLTSGSVFTGTSDDCLNYNEIRISVKADVASATDGLSIQQSSDNTNWDIIDTYTVSANAGKTIAVPRQARYFRIVYTNGGTGQSSFRLQTILNRLGAQASSQRPSDGYTNETDLAQVQSFPMVYNGSTWDRTKSVATGIQAVGVSDGTSTAAIVAPGTANSTGNAQLVAPTTWSPAAWSVTSVTGGTVYDAGNFTSVKVQVLSQYTGTTPTITWQVSNDGVTWVGQGLTLSTSIGATNAALNTTITGLYEGNLRGRYFRLNFTGVYASGTSTGNIVFSTNPTAPFPNSGTVSTQGVKTNNNGIPGGTNIGVLPGVASAAQSTWTESFQVLASMNLKGSQRMVLQDAALNDRGVNVNASNQLEVNAGTVAGTSLNTYATRITSNTTTSPTSSTAYISSITITTEVAGTTSTVTIRDKQGTPQVLVNGLTTTAASLTPTVLNFQTPVKMTSGIDIVTAGAVAGTVDVWVNYYQ